MLVRKMASVHALVCSPSRQQRYLLLNGQQGLRVSGGNVAGRGRQAPQRQDAAARRLTGWADEPPPGGRLGAPLVADHPGPLACEGLAAVRCSHCRAAFGRRARAAPAARRMSQAAIVAITRRPRRVTGTLVGLVCCARLTAQAGQTRCGHEDAGRSGAAVRAAAGLIALRQAAQRLEAPAGRTGVVIGGHAGLLGLTSCRARSASARCRR